MIGAMPAHDHPAERVVPEPLVAEAPIWGANNGFKGYAFLPVTIRGHAATVVLNLNCTECDLLLSTAALARIGVTWPQTTATHLNTLVIGTDVQRNVPLTVTTKPNWSVPGPEALPPVIGTVGVHFLTTRYDIEYDFPHRRVRLYAIPPKPVAPSKAWLPAGFTLTDCGRMIPIPPGAGTFTGVEMQLDGHPVTGVLEMGPYQEKMNNAALQAMGLTEHSSRVQPIPAGTLPPGYSHQGYVITKQVPEVHLRVGTHTFWTGPVQIFPVLDVEELLTSTTPVMLMNLSTLRKVRLFNATSSQQVCIATP
jgi:hypothetical protein